MPKAGIQGTFSTNWNSGEVGSNRAHRTSVRANTNSEMPKPSCRTTPARSSSLPGTSRTSTAPTRGTAMSRLSRYAVIPVLERRHLAESPDVVAEHEHDAEQD